MWVTKQNKTEQNLQIQTKFKIQKIQACSGQYSNLTD